jgi:acetyl-CoA carboxylase alpha subunit
VPETCRRVGEAIDRALAGLAEMSPEQIVAQRYDRFRGLGVVVEG